jgi:HD-like signal output (HDOD) protein
MSFENLFRQVLNIPSIPKVVQELINNFNDSNTSARDIAQKLQMDQTLSVKVLRLANSARYGCGRKINSIDAAVITLGFDALKTLVIASGLTAACKSIPGLNQKQFWRTSFSVANLTKMFAKLSGRDGEVAYTCGLLHNIGDTLLFLTHKEQMANIEVMCATGADRATLQQSQFGCDFTDVGAELARRWNFPEEICLAIAYQQKPEQCPSPNTYPLLLHLAIHLHDDLSSGKKPAEAVAHLPKEKAADLNIDTLQLLEQLTYLLNKEDDIESFIN